MTPLDHVETPACYSQWREVPAPVASAEQLLFGLTMTSDGPDAVKVVTPDGQIIAIAHKGEQRWWVCDIPQKPGAGT